MDLEEHSAVDELNLWARALEREIRQYQAIFRKLLRLRLAGDRFAGDRMSELHLQQAATGHFIVIAGQHVVKVFNSDRLPAQLQHLAPSNDLAKQFTYLRHIGEHWEEYKPWNGAPSGGARHDYEWDFADRTPWSISYSINRGITIGGILSLEEVKGALIPLLQALVAEIDASSLALPIKATA